MKLITLLLRYSWAVVFTATLLGIVGGASSAALLALINTQLSRTDREAGTLVWSFVGLVLVSLITNLLSRVLFIRLSQRVVFDLRLRLCRQILSAPLPQIEQAGLPRLFAALTEDIPTVVHALFQLPSLCTNLAILIGCLGYLGSLSLMAGGLLVGYLTITFAGYTLFFDQQAKHYLKLGREEWDRLVVHFEALTQGNKELKLHRPRQEAFLREQLEPSATEMERISIQGGSLYAVGVVWSQILYFIFIGLVLFGLPTIHTAVLTGYTLTALYLSVPVTGLLDIFPALRRANISMRQIEGLGLSLLTQQRDEPTYPPSQTWNSLVLQGVTRTYQQGQTAQNFTLGPVDVTFRPGELVFLVGGNGSGKTTLAKLLVGLYSPQVGEIYLDGRRITEQNQDSYRQFFSAIFTDFYLFDRLLGLDSPGLDYSARAYLEKLQLEHRVTIKEGMVSTLALSQGQRKRLALLTACLEDRPFYVFDEWAANQDPQFQQVFYLELLQELKARGKTILVISHDDQYFHVADRVIYLDQGRICSVSKPVTYAANGSVPEGSSRML
ncbi:cyclic peptide export ABC transporter [Anthocerotibacter panamensis]|uniref:cyclic peptide export ABC transporter n=1 Tax=Anthocerotibacter panamensis TaxID=2857077 RepID=UPI001C404FAB|nr:cyclic peptide export ABC transporter [Anthocerotibacter panamensis]